MFGKYTSPHGIGNAAAVVLPWRQLASNITNSHQSRSTCRFQDLLLHLFNRKQVKSSIVCTSNPTLLNRTQLRWYIIHLPTASCSFTFPVALGWCRGITKTPHKTCTEEMTNDATQNSERKRHTGPHGKHQQSQCTNDRKSHGILGVKKIGRNEKCTKNKKVALQRNDQFFLVGLFQN